jgi:ABC-type hemin transport system ATPase subunit
MLGHTILYPAHSHHQARRGGDVLTLLADLLAARRMGDRVRLLSRGGVDHAKRFRDVAAAIAALPPARLVTPPR